MHRTEKQDQGQGEDHGEKAHPAAKRLYADSESFQKRHKQPLSAESQTVCVSELRIKEGSAFQRSIRPEQRIRTIRLELCDKSIAPYVILDDPECTDQEQSNK